MMNTPQIREVMAMSLRLFSNAPCRSNARVLATGQFGAKAKVQNMLPGLGIQFSGGLQHSEGRPGRSAGFSADYTIEKPGFTGQLGFEQNRLVMSGMLGVRNALLGAATEFDSDSGAVAEPVLMARYNGDSFLLSASGRAGGDSAEVTLQQRISENLSAAAGVTINSVTLGVQHDSDFALVRAKAGAAPQPPPRRREALPVSEAARPRAAAASRARLPAAPRA